MGDFNIDLLNYESHHLTEDEFLIISANDNQADKNYWSFCYFDSSYFFNSLEYYTVGGNIIYDISNHLPNFVLIDNANLVTTIPPTNNSSTDYLKNSPAHSFSLFTCTHNEIQLEVDKLSTGKATGPYSFPAAIIKILKLVMAKTLRNYLQFFIRISSCTIEI